MGFNEYARDSVMYGDDVDLDAEYDYDEPDPLSPEDWQDWHSQHLLNMWMSLEEYRQDRYIKARMMQHATFNSFCEYAWNNSHQ